MVVGYEKDELEETSDANKRMQKAGWLADKKLAKKRKGTSKGRVCTMIGIIPSVYSSMCLLGKGSWPVSHSTSLEANGQADYHVIHSAGALLCLWQSGSLTPAVLEDWEQEPEENYWIQRVSFE